MASGARVQSQSLRPPAAASLAVLELLHPLHKSAPEAVLTEALLLQTFGQRVVLSPHPTHGVPLVALVPNGNARQISPLPVEDQMA